MLINNLLRVVALFPLIAFSITINAQTNRNLEREKPGAAQTGRRVALVIGNGAYTKAKSLPNPANDAVDMARALRDVGFEVYSGTDMTKRQMESLIRDFGQKLANGGTGLFYYAGHGIQVGGENYLVPVDAEIPQEDEVAYAAVPVSLVLTKMSTAKNDLNIVILDACRNNPFARSWRGYRDAGNNDGLAKISPPTGTLVLYSTEPGKVASDGAGRNGLFTEALLKQIKRPNIEYDQMVKALSTDVWQRSNKQQLPWKEGNSLQDFYFAVGPTPPSGPGTVIVPPPGSTTIPGRVVPSDGSPASGTVRKNPIGMELVYIPAGDFMMGSTDAEVDEALYECKKYNAECKREYFTPEMPKHRVTIREGFWMGKYEVTQGQWQAVMGDNPSKFADCGANCPVEQVSWDDIQVFLKRMNAKNDGYEYSLPSEAQWEYTARAGTTTAFAFGDSLNSSQANFNGEYPYASTKGANIGKTVTIGRYQPNAWGLYDMHGNVWEWVQDVYNSNYTGLPTDGSANTSVGDSSRRVLRGGSWYVIADVTRSAFRDYFVPSVRINYDGFRVAARPQ